MDTNINIEAIASDSPLSPAQSAWIGGYFAGMQDAMASMAHTGQTQQQPLFVLYGSQTGNAEAFAQDFADMANAECIDMADVETEDFATYKNIVIVTSTYGDGEHPDNGQILWDAIQDMGKIDCNYAIIGLGDTAYDFFCKSAEDWDQYFDGRGAKRVLDTVKLDVDFADFQDDIMAKTKTAFDTVRGNLVADTTDATITKTKGGDAKPVPKKSSSGHASKYTRTAPYKGELLTHTLLSSTQSSKRVYHFEFEVDDPEMAYEAGDALGVIAINSDTLVQNIITAGGFDGTKNFDGKSFYDILKTEREIRLPNRDFISLVTKNCQDSELQNLHADKKAMDSWLWGRETVDILQHFDHKLSEQDFLNIMKPIQHRLYSISSSPKAHPGEVHLTVGAVEYDFNGRPCQGVASCFLAERLAIGDTVGLFIHGNKAFSIPENGDTPIIMVGPGTGIAPFRAFLEHRIATHATGDNWLFFGDRTKANDFLYGDTLSDWEKQGKVRLSLAWSRDPNMKKTYVQDLMLQQGEDMFNQFEKGAYFYVCGDASRMAKDVNAALLEIISTHGAMSIDKATAYINDLKKNKRYVRDVY